MISKLTKIKIKGKLKGLLMTKKEKKRLRLARKEARKQAKAKYQNNMEAIVNRHVSTISTMQQQATVSEGTAGVQIKPVQGSDNTVSEWKPSTSISKGLSTYNYISSCNHAPCFNASLGSQNLFTATKSELSNQTCIDFDLDAVINCSQGSVFSTSSSLIKGHGVFRSLNKYQVRTKELWLDWQDGASWPFGLYFWQDLFAINQEQGFKNIVFVCYGGHGRTGSAFCAYVLCNSWLESESPIEEVNKAVQTLRDVYCSEVVETKEQVSYLLRLATAKLEQQKANPEPEVKLTVAWIQASQVQEKEATLFNDMGYSIEKKPNTVTKIEWKNGKPYTIDGIDLCPECFDLKIDCACNRPASYDNIMEANQAILTELASVPR